MKAIKVDDEAYKLLEELANKQQTTIKELATRAINIYLRGTEIEPTGKEIKDITEKFIQLKYSTKCRKCGCIMNEGETAYYTKYIYEDGTQKTMIYCVNCYYEYMLSDKTLANYYVKKKELETIIRGLRKKADELSKQIIAEQKFSELFDYFVRAKQLISTLISKRNITAEESQLVADELMRIYDEIDKILKTLSTVKTFVKTLRPKKIWARP